MKTIRFNFLIALTLLSSLLFAGEGIEYSQIHTSSRQIIHLIKVDPGLYDIKSVKAVDDGIGRESVASLATRHGAIAAVNGSFFSIGSVFDGRACGALKIHEWYALPTKPRGCIGWSSHDKTAIFDRLLVSIEGYNEGGSFSIDGLNRPREAGEIILYTPVFHRTTLTNPDGEEIVVKEGLITAIRRGKGSAPIPNNGSVFSVQKDHPNFGSFKVGARLAFRTTIKPQKGLTSSKDWEACDYVVGGTPLLICDRTKISDFSPELTIATFIQNRHSRTAVGILPTGHWIFVVLDKDEALDGMTIDELTNFMSSMGCVYALNLDGGGSSTLVYEGEVVNSPHGDEDEGADRKIVRRVSDAIVMIPNEPLTTTTYQVR